MNDTPVEKKASEIFEGENSSLRKTFEEATAYSQSVVEKSIKEWDKVADEILGQSVVEWEKEFDEKFGSSNGGAMPSGLDTARKIKDFIRTELLSARAATIDECERECGLKKETVDRTYHHIGWNDACRVAKDAFTRMRGVND